MKTTKDKELLIEQLKRTPIIQIACEKVGVSRATFYRLRKRDRQFAEASAEAIEQGAAVISDLAEAQLLNAIKNGNLQAILYWLKHRHPAYARRLEVNGTLKHEDGRLTKEQEELVLKALEMARIYNPKEQK